MNDNGPAGRRFGELVGRFFGHSAAIIAGLVMMIAGLGLGVTLVALPIGIMVGLGGLLLFLWGLFAFPGEKRT